MICQHNNHWGILYNKKTTQILSESWKEDFVLNYKASADAYS